MHTVFFGYKNAPNLVERVNYLKGCCQYFKNKRKTSRANTKMYIERNRENWAQYQSTVLFGVINIFKNNCSTILNRASRRCFVVKIVKCMQLQLPKYNITRVLCLLLVFSLFMIHDRFYILYIITVLSYLDDLCTSTV